MLRDQKATPDIITTRVVLNRQHIRLIIGALLVVSLLLALGTWMVGRYWQRYRLPWDEWPVFYKLLMQTNLVRENDVAVWFSSMLLLLIALTCMLCFAAEPRGQDKSWLRFGWAISALMFAGLSLDEMGSLHEKIAIWNKSMSWFVLLVPFVIMIPIYMLFFGWIQIRRSRAGFVYTLLGVLCFSTVPLFEFFERNSLSATGQQLRNSHLFWQTMEEGTELLGMMAFLTATLCFATAIVRMPDNSPKETSAVVRVELSRRRFLGITTLLTLSGFTGVFVSKAYIPIINVAGVNGIPENWFPSALIFCAAVMLIQMSGTGTARIARRSLVVAAILVSIYIGSNLQDFFYPGQNVVLKRVFIAMLFVPALLSAITESGRMTKCVGILAASALPATILAGPGIFTAPVGVAAAAILMGFTGYLLSFPDRKSAQ